MNEADAEIYLEEYWRLRESGDDDMNAKLRIIEMGCPKEVADAIEEACDDGEER